MTTERTESLKQNIKNTLDTINSSSPVIITILEYNKYKLIVNRPFSTLDIFIDCLLQQFNKDNFIFNGGNKKEFYIKNTTREVTFQVSTFDFCDDSLDF